VDLYEAHGDFANLMVGDGTIDTRMSVQLGTEVTVADQVLPNGIALDRTLLLGAAQESAYIGITLSNGSGTILNEGEEFSLTADRHYVFFAFGHIDEIQGALKPTLLKLNPLASPGVSRVQLRFVHGLAGNPNPVDVHVNGEVIESVAYGSASTPVIFEARPVGQDSLLVVPAGVTPNGSNEIWKSTGQILFYMDSHYEAVLSHHANSLFDGDILGQASLLLVENR